MHKKEFIPHYQGTDWIKPALPDKSQAWPLSQCHSAGHDSGNRAIINSELKQLYQDQPWQWPSKPIFFFSDLHADADAFWASLVASGGIKKTGADDNQFKLTPQGKSARFVIGGDCFDKGPSNLRLLRCLKKLIDKGAKVHILAGNHDLRVKIGIYSVNHRSKLTNEHFFLRMGKKAIPFLREIEREYLQHKHAYDHIPSEKECKKRLHPSADWFKHFDEKSSHLLSSKAIKKELRRMQEKAERFAHQLQQANLDYRKAYAAALQWQALFLQEDGEFYWYFKRMRLALHKGSFLFVHAGIDDQIADLISQHGVKQLNRDYKTNLHSSLSDFYYGPIANTVRTKYRDVDKPLSKHGIKQLKHKGIHAIVHGHKNTHHGQRIMLRKGLVNFECDASVDRATRKNEKIGPHYGAAVTIIKPQKHILGISSDYPYVKVFQPDTLIL